ncbi:MAG: adenylate/guanylate cyclase domain-containing protein [Deltaproteobacteria bacterium]|nr:adenylate/guanylate cyclase domain-containing protein [Deltaproteobacteria bacterium]
MEDATALVLTGDPSLRTKAVARLVGALTCHFAADKQGALQWLESWSARRDHAAPPILVVAERRKHAATWIEILRESQLAASCPSLWLYVDDEPPEPTDAGFDLLLPMACPEVALQAAVRTLAHQSRRERQLLEMARHVPRALLWAIDRGESLQPTQKRLTILFADLRGFTDASGFSSPAEIVSLLNDYIEAASNVIGGAGGVLDKFTGDGICAYFGYEGRDDAAASAVRAALQLQEVLERFKVDWFDRGVLPMGAGVGVTTGLVAVGPIGAKDRADYTIIGSTVNLAARLQAFAKGGEVVVDAPTADLVRHLFALSPPRAVTVKGFSQPVTVHTVAVGPAGGRKMISLADL